MLITLRYAAKSDALLAVTKHDPTCVLEVDGIDRNLTREVARRVLANLEAAGTPYTAHWGKMNELNCAQIEPVYRPSVQQWIDTRNAILAPDVRAVFTSPELVRLGLDS